MFNNPKIVLSLVLVAVITACNQKKATQPNEREQIVQEINGIPETWIDNRVKKAKVRLQSSEAGKVVWNAIQAHGGLETWHKNGALAFRFNYQPLDGSTPRDSYQVIDTWRNRAIHTSPQDSTAQYGYTGETTWIKAKDSTVFKYDTKFWAMTPLYLMGFPFVLDGEGVNFELLSQSEYKGNTNDVVKITFDEGTGDAPDDYYILQFDADTHLLTATRYIVSYPEYFKDGGHLPEKFMEVGPLVNVEGILLPEMLKTHWTVEGQPGEYITKIEISDIEFRDDLNEDFFDMPLGAEKL